MQKPASPANPVAITISRRAYIFLIGATLLAVLLCPLGLLLADYAYLQLFERILPGVRVGKTELGGKSVYQAATWLNKDWNMEGKIAVGWVVNDAIQSEYFSPRQLGLGVDVVKTARDAYGVGHGQSLTSEISQLVRSTLYGWEVAPVVTFDLQAARSGLESLATRISIPTQNAGLQIEGGKVSTTPPVPGTTIDIETALTHIASDSTTILTEGYLLLPLKGVPPAIADVSAIAAEAEKLLDTPLHLKGYDPVTDESFDWLVNPAILGGWLKVATDADGPHLEVNKDRLDLYLSELGKGLGSERFVDTARYTPSLAEAVLHQSPFTLIVNHTPSSYLVKSGDTLLRIAWNVGIPFWRIDAANPELDPDKLNAGQQLIIPSKDDLLPLPVIPNKRIVISISRQRLWTTQDGQLRSEHLISTGVDRSPTQPGIFQVQTHELTAYASVWDLYMPHFLGIYEAWPGFMNGIHGLPTLSNGVRLWESILGRPASFGCIILDLQAAQDLYFWAEDGVVVEIQP